MTKSRGGGQKAMLGGHDIGRKHFKGADIWCNLGGVSMIICLAWWVRDELLTKATRLDTGDHMGGDIGPGLSYTRRSWHALFF